MPGCPMRFPRFLGVHLRNSTYERLKAEAELRELPVAVLARQIIHNAVVGPSQRIRLEIDPEPSPNKPRIANPRTGQVK